MFVFGFSCQDAQNSVECVGKAQAFLGRGQHLEQPIFRNFEISSVKRTKSELFDFFYFGIYFLILYLFKLFKHSK